MSLLQAKEYKTKIIHGYMRQNHLDRSIPMDIINLCYQFYDSIVYHKLCGHQLKSFYNQTNGVSVQTSQFMIGDVIFETHLYPNGKRTKTKGYVEYYVTLKSKPSNIISLTVYFVLFCKERNYEFRSNAKFTYNGQSKGWAAFNMLLSDIQQINYRQLNFGCYVEILDMRCSATNKSSTMVKQSPLLNRIKMEITKEFNSNVAAKLFQIIEEQQFDDETIWYDIKNPSYSFLKDKLSDAQFCCVRCVCKQYQSNKQIDFNLWRIYSLPNIKMNTFIKYDWIIDDELLIQFKNAKTGIGFYSDNFNNNCWCLACAPYGTKPTNQDKFVWRLKLLKLPIFVKRLGVEYTLECNYNENGNTIWSQYEDFGYTKNTGSWPENHKIFGDDSSINDVNSLTLSACIRIKSVFDSEGKEMDINDWKYYGILDN